MSYSNFWWGEEAAERDFCVCKKQIICERFQKIIISMKRENDARGEIIKNPFDIVQLTLQLLAPLTELMELAEIPV